MKVEDIFNKISKQENHEFKVNQLYEPKSYFEVKDHNNNWVKVVGMIIKEDDLIGITTANHQLKVGSKHAIQLANNDFKYCQNLKVGDTLKNIYGDEIITEVKDLNTKQIVYDVSLDTDDHVYSDNNGFVHHNTFGVKKLLKGTNHEFFTGAITSASALYKTLYINNDPNKIIVFDDLDSLLDDKDCVNMLKGALDSGKETEISYLSNNTVPPLFFETILKYEAIEDVVNNEELVAQLMKQKVNIEAMAAGQNAQRLWEVYRIRASSPTKANAIMPNKFNFDGRVIFISNKYLHQIPGAIKSRAMTVEVSLSLSEIVKRIEEVMPYIEIENATPAHKKEALKFIKEKVVPSKRVKKLDFRTFVDIVKFAMSDSPDELWHRWAAVSIMQKYAGATEAQKVKR